MFARIVFTTFFGLMCQCTFINAQSDSTSTRLAETYQKVYSSVVFVEVGTAIERTGSGSGFILHADGYIATAAHVVEDADVVRVTFHDDTFCHATIVTMCREQDLALLKVEALPEGAKPVTLGVDSKVTPGEQVFCVGAPYDLRFSVTSGIVSGIREDLGRFDFVWKLPSRLIQTDTAINPGNSGGPVFNSKGEVIGVAAAIIKDAKGIGWAVPVEYIRRYLLDQAVPFGGVVYLRVTPEFASLMNWQPSEALIVERVQNGSLAEKSGLRGGQIKVEIGGLSIMLGGDVIYFIGNHPVSEYQKVQNYLRTLTKKDEIKMTVWREGKMVELHAPFEILDQVPNIQLPGSMGPATPEHTRLNKKSRWGASDAP